MPRWRLREYLIALALIALLPALVVTGLAVMRIGNAYRETSEEQLITTARLIAQALEGELAVTAKAIGAIAANVQRDEHDVSRRLLADDAHAVFGQTPLRVKSFRIENGRLSTDSEPDPALRSALLASAASHEWAVSNLFGDNAGRPDRIAITLPDTVTPDGITTILSLTLSPESLVRAAHHPSGSNGDNTILIAVTDGNGRLLARSRGEQTVVGQSVPDWSRLLDLASDTGVFQARSLEGETVTFGFNRIARTPGWTVVVGQPKMMFDSRWQQPLRWLILSSIVAIAIALLLAAAIAQMILRPVQALARRAQHVASGSPVSGSTIDARSEVVEFEMLRERLQSSEAALRSRAEAERRNAENLLASERRYRALAEASAQVIWRRSIRNEVTAATGWQKLTGQPDESALGDGWMQRTHPDDLDDVRVEWEKAKSSLRPVDVEFRIMAGNGDWRWVRARGVPLRAVSGESIEWIGVLEDIDAQRREREHVIHLATHDSLTGLPNRTLFHDLLDRTIALTDRGQIGRLLYLDLDGFKSVNDRYGHAVGDALLRAVTQRLSSIVRKSDMVSRLGGDEFAILQPDVKSDSNETDLPARVIAELGSPFEIEGHLITIGVSIGLAHIRRSDHDAEHLLRQADVALYNAKALGRGRFVSIDDGISPPSDPSRT
jgi:diguanylate cyclase (GGDEF)-like protein/PAS domain S-box-containing protein